MAKSPTGANTSGSNTAGAPSERDARTYLLEDRFLAIFAQIEKMEAGTKAVAVELRNIVETSIRTRSNLDSHSERLSELEVEFATGASSHENSMANRMIKFHDRLNSVEKDNVKFAQTCDNILKVIQDVKILERIVKEDESDKNDNKGFLRSAVIEWAPHILTWLGFLILYLSTKSK